MARRTRTFTPKRWFGRLGLVLDLADDGALRDGGARLDRQPGDGAVLVGGDRVLHLHGLEHHDEVTGRDLLTLLDGDLDHGALHRCGDRVAGCGRCPAGPTLAWLGLLADGPGRGHGATIADCEVAR